MVALWATGIGVVLTACASGGPAPVGTVTVAASSAPSSQIPGTTEDAPSSVPSQSGTTSSEQRTTSGDASAHLPDATQRPTEAAPSEPSAPAVNGSTWVGEDTAFGRIRFRLEEGGAATVWTKQDGMSDFETLECVGCQYRWRANGRAVTIFADDRTWVFEGTVAGDRFSGVATYIRGATYRFDVRRSS